MNIQPHLGSKKGRTRYYTKVQSKCKYGSPQI